MTKTFDLEKAMRNGGKCVTRDGRPARIVCTDRITEYGTTILALIKNGREEYTSAHYSDGRFGEPVEKSCHDLFNIPEKKKGWIAHKANKYHCDRVTTPIFPDKHLLEQYLRGFAYPEEKWITQEIEWEE